MGRQAFCPAGHDQAPLPGPPVEAVIDGKLIALPTRKSGPRKDRPGRCHRCGAVLQHVTVEDDAADSEGAI